MDKKCFLFHYYIIFHWRWLFYLSQKCIYLHVDCWPSTKISISIVCLLLFLFHHEIWTIQAQLSCPILQKMKKEINVNFQANNLFFPNLYLKRGWKSVDKTFTNKRKTINLLLNLEMKWNWQQVQSIPWNWYNCCGNYFFAVTFQKTECFEQWALKIEQLKGCGTSFSTFDYYLYFMFKNACLDSIQVDRDKCAPLFLITQWNLISIFPTKKKKTESALNDFFLTSFQQRITFLPQKSYFVSIIITNRKACGPMPCSCALFQNTSLESENRKYHFLLQTPQIHTLILHKQLHLNSLVTCQFGFKFIVISISLRVLSLKLRQTATTTTTMAIHTFRFINKQRGGLLFLMPKWQ